MLSNNVIQHELAPDNLVWSHVHRGFILQKSSMVMWDYRWLPTFLISLNPPAKQWLINIVHCKVRKINLFSTALQSAPSQHTIPSTRKESLNQGE